MYDTHEKTFSSIIHVKRRETKVESSPNPTWISICLPLTVWLYDLVSSRQVMLYATSLFDTWVLRGDLAVTHVQSQCHDCNAASMYRCILWQVLVYLYCYPCIFAVTLGSAWLDWLLPPSVCSVLILSAGQKGWLNMAFLHWWVGKKKSRDWSCPTLFTSSLYQRFHYF